MKEIRLCDIPFKVPDNAKIVKIPVYEDMKLIPPHEFGRVAQEPTEIKTEIYRIIRRK